MKKQLRLSHVIFKNVEKITRSEMEDIKGREDLYSESCHMFCRVCGDSLGELIYFLPTTDSGDIPGC